MENLNFKCKITTKVKRVDFVDVTLKLVNHVFQIYVKNNENTIYIHPKSNQTLFVIKHIPSSVKRRISKHSSDKDVLDNYSSVYNNVLKNSAYKYTYKYA